MGKIVQKQIAYCLKSELFDDDVLDEVSVAVGLYPTQVKNYGAIQLAARTLLEDMAGFEPPVMDVREEDIRINIGSSLVTAAYIRRDAHTEKALGYTFVNYPPLLEMSPTEEMVVEAVLSTSE